MGDARTARAPDTKLMNFTKAQQERYSLRDERGTVGLTTAEQARLQAAYAALRPTRTHVREGA